MVFSSLPSYLDHPNWPQQQPVGGLGGSGSGGSGQEFTQLPPPLMPPPPLMAGGVDARSIHITDRGRMTKLPQPDTAMKCPRCESTNTKFCYFNNYSLSQPRHFCKTCRRYWTRGGALRNVPVGGGCRRNKKSSKGSRVSRSKSPGATTTSINNTPISPTSCSTENILGHNLAHNNRPPQYPILPSVHRFGGGDLGLTFGGGNGTDLMNLGHDQSNYPSNKFGHFPFMEANNGGMYGEGPSNYGEQVEGMKMEQNHHQQQHQGMNLSRNFLGISGNDQFLGTSNAAWGTTDLSGFASSSTTTAPHLL